MTGNSGPLGGSTNRPVIDEGTLIQHRSPSPGPIGIAAQNSLHVTPENESRGLTVGEIQMAKKIFKDSINYARVRVHNEGYFPFGLQNANTAVTPNGEIYFLPDDFEEDFSTSKDWKKRWFMHEMTHVWQYQLGYWVRFRGAIRAGLDYSYTLDEQMKFCDYNMEAQGDILADYFALKFLNKPGLISNLLIAHPPDTYSVEEYERTLQNFLIDPSNSENLP